MGLIVREALVSDADKMLKIQLQVLAEQNYLLTTLEEFNQTVEGQKKWIEQKQVNERDVIFVAELEGEIVGWLMFQSPPRKRIFHTGTFGMMVDSNIRGQGIGTLLLTRLIDWATVNPSIEKICLGVFSTNENAIKLYQKMGFLEEGRKVREIKLDNGEYIDDILMYRFVK
ncbi:GNAT family N-acetyltransferase [Lysinibacillus xylanilyticus]|uniref:GNAT family N-acetyltransferase n=1 Tax=Lysinibacillus xylanilyticus TaxID=582475 RepID=UPI002B248E2F|nr:GNAT family N-acetyltransferase [Lysinibacillus xylanilyticus]MEB2300326.1 GNAT family N-acetyltransferase [Lysinibacillus xylanilyticus]